MWVYIIITHTLCTLRSSEEHSTQLWANTSMTELRPLCLDSLHLMP